MRHDLDCLSQIVAVALAVNDRLVDASRRYTVVLCGAYACEPFVVTQVEVGLKAVLRDVAFTVFVGVQRTWIDVDVRVELLDGDLKTASL